ncbi:DNA polymerase III subunit delta [Mycoplasmatota bacterium]|nr:DNA polymerase III subunit delta [Mycoplasmatota bacterium]
MSNLYLLTGVNKFQIDAKIKQLIGKSQVSELSLVKYDCEETTIDEILNDCETLPFLSDHKLVIMNHPIFLSSEKSKLEHNIKRLISYIEHPNESTILIINASDIKLDKKKKINKLLLDKAEVLNYDNLTELEARNLISQSMKQLNVQISHDAINELIMRTECDALKLHSELNKLSFYLENKNEITLEDIRLLVCEPIENNIFSLTNLFIERKIEQSVKIYHQLLMNNEEPIVFSSVLGKNFHNLYLIKQYQKKFFTEYQLKNILKIHPYQLKKLYQIAQRTKEEDIIKNIHALSEYDSMVKTGRIDKYLGFELLILNM